MAIYMTIYGHTWSYSRHVLGVHRVRSQHSISLTAGALAGVAVEMALFPIDCLKTRAQSRQGLKPGPLIVDYHTRMTTIFMYFLDRLLDLDGPYLPLPWPSPDLPTSRLTPLTCGNPDPTGSKQIFDLTYFDTF